MNWPQKRIGDYLTESGIEISAPSAERRIRVRLNAEGIEKRPLIAETEGATRYFQRKAGQFIYGKQNLHKGAFGVVPPELDGFESSSDLPAFDVADGLRPKWLEYFLKQGNFYKSLVAIAKGAATKRIQPEALFAVELPVPSTKEQDEIIKRMDLCALEHTRLVHEITHQKSLVAKLKQAILQEAVQGKLTADWRVTHLDVEPASQLLQRIQAEKAHLIAVKKLRPEKPLPKITPAEIPFEIPKGWEWCRMGEAGVFQRGKSKHRPRNDPRLFEDGDIPFVQTGDVARSKRNGFMIETSTGYYNEFGLAQSRLWPDGTMCITIAANIAETGFLTFPACIPDSVVAFTPAVEGKTPQFLRMFIELTRTAIEQFAPATAQKNINLEIINELMLPLPPLAEQAAIVERVEALMTTCRALEAEIEHARTHATNLLQAVLKEAFA
jgi:type I restriction enzyme S subunit